MLQVSLATNATNYLPLQLRVTTGIIFLKIISESVLLAESSMADFHILKNTQRKGHMECIMYSSIAVFHQN
jgi:hypothetical protein